MNHLINHNPTAAALAAFGFFAIFAAILIARAVHKYRQGDPHFDPLATAHQPARRALDGRPWWRTMKTEEPRPSFEGTGTPRPDSPCPACGRHWGFGGCDTCKEHGFSEFLRIDDRPYNPATDVSHSNIGTQEGIHSEERQ